MSKVTSALNDILLWNHGGESGGSEVSCMKVSVGLWNRLKDEQDVTVLDNYMMKYKSTFGIFYLYKVQ